MAREVSQVTEVWDCINTTFVLFDTEEEKDNATSEHIYGLLIKKRAGGKAENSQEMLKERYFQVKKNENKTKV